MLHFDNRILAPLQVFCFRFGKSIARPLSPTASSNTMSDVDIFLSNGTCYYAPGQRADRAMIPCGNSHYFGPLTCCQQGDKCLASNACFNSEFGVTYLAGCSDPEYEDPSCPEKEGFEGMCRDSGARVQSIDIARRRGALGRARVLQRNLERMDCLRPVEIVRHSRARRPLLVS